MQSIGPLQQVNVYRSRSMYNGRFKAWLAKKIDCVRDVNSQQGNKHEASECQMKLQTRGISDIIESET